MIKLACTNLIRVVDSQLCLMIRRKKKQKNNQAEQQKQKQTQQVDSHTRLKKKLSKLRKENKFTNKTYFELYPSDPIPSRLYGTIKAHKPEQNPSYESHCIHNRYPALWNIKISCRYHSADTQQKPIQSKKLKIICFAS